MMPDFGVNTDALGRGLGIIFAALTFLLKAPIGFFAGALSSWLRARPAVLRWMFRSSGAILIGLNVRLALERRQ